MGKIDGDTVAEGIGMFVVMLPFAGGGWGAGYEIAGWPGLAVAVVLWPWPLIWLGLRKL